MKLWQNEGGEFFFFFFFHWMTIFQPQIQAVNGDSNIICISGPYFNIRFYMFSHIKNLQEEDGDNKSAEWASDFYGHCCRCRRCCYCCSCCCLATGLVASSLKYQAVLTVYKDGRRHSDITHWFWSLEVSFTLSGAAWSLFFENEKSPYLDVWWAVPGGSELWLDREFNVWHPPPLHPPPPNTRPPDNYIWLLNFSHDHNFIVYLRIGPEAPPIYFYSQQSETR